MAEADADKVCFVVMGFGKKTDYETGRTLDLECDLRGDHQARGGRGGLRCVRADEVVHSGVIDLPMYQMLLTPTW